MASSFTSSSHSDYSAATFVNPSSNTSDIQSEASLSIDSPIHSTEAQASPSPLSNESLEHSFKSQQNISLPFTHRPQVHMADTSSVSLQSYPANTTNHIRFRGGCYEIAINQYPRLGDAILVPVIEFERTPCRKEDEKRVWAWSRKTQTSLLGLGLDVLTGLLIGIPFGILRDPATTNAACFNEQIGALAFALGPILVAHGFASLIGRVRALHNLDSNGALQRMILALLTLGIVTWFKLKLEDICG